MLTQASTESLIEHHRRTVLDASIATAHLIMERLDTIQPTYIYVTSEPPQLHSCMICNDEVRRECKLLSGWAAHAYTLCSRCFNQCRQAQKAIITSTVMSRRLRLLAPQFNDHQVRSGGMCILCCDRSGKYKCDREFADECRYICVRCKRRGTVLVCVDVILALRCWLLPELRYKIAMLTHASMG